MAVLVVLIGTRGAGKTTVLEFLRENGVFVLTPSTDRLPRDGEDSEYHFEAAWPSTDLEWVINVDKHKYGMRRSEVDELTKRGVGATVFEPGNVGVLEEFRLRGRAEVVTLGLDTVKSVEEQERRVGTDEGRVVSERKLESDRRVVEDCDAVLQGTAGVIGEAALVVCNVLGSRGGVLEGTALRALMRAGTLLTDGNEENVQGASYDLRLGEQAWCQGEFVFLSRQNPSLSIPAYSYAIVTAQEEARIPRFLTGRYDLTVSGFMDGLVLSNGPQVDPGYRGSLFCTLFNGRDVARGVTLGRHFATIEFVTTTRVSEGYSGEYQDKKDLAAFVSENTAVSPGGNIVERIDNLERSIDDKVAPVRQFWFGSLGIVILIHMILAGWVWLGGSDLVASLTKDAKQDKQEIQLEQNSDGNREGTGQMFQKKGDDRKVEQFREPQ
ncbi:MAG: hypothetical protein OXN90_08630 [Gemmatimonadota bacterium]|nr:hypothetical protein [Gemmatimonadota bacterium]